MHRGTLDIHGNKGNKGNGVTNRNSLRISATVCYPSPKDHSK
jgi:hypothetical protein